MSHQETEDIDTNKALLHEMRMLRQEISELRSNLRKQGVHEFTKIKSGGTKRVFVLRNKEELSDNLKDMYRILKDNGFIDCRLDRFKYIFSGLKMTTHGKVHWIGNKNELKYFIDGLSPFLEKMGREKWVVTLNCFKGDFSEIEQISKAHAEQVIEIKQRILDTCVDIFK